MRMRSAPCVLKAYDDVVEVDVMASAPGQCRAGKQLWAKPPWAGCGGAAAAQTAAGGPPSGWCPNAAFACGSSSAGATTHVRGAQEMAAPAACSATASSKHACSRGPTAALRLAPPRREPSLLSQLSLKLSNSTPSFTRSPMTGQQPGLPRLPGMPIWLPACWALHT